MITSGTIKTVLLKALKADTILGLLPEIKKGILKPVTETNVTERISIQCNTSDNEDWKNSFAYVYVYCPLVNFKDGDVTYKRRNEFRVDILEYATLLLFQKRTLLKIDGDALYYQLDQLTIEDEEETFSTVITAKLRVTNENFKN